MKSGAVGIRKKMAFTLIELMIVIGIIGVLAAVAIPRFADALEKANLGATLGNMGAIKSAITVYYTSYAMLPEDLNPEEPGLRTIMPEIPGVECRYPMLSSPYGNQVTRGTSIPSGAGQGWYYNYNEGSLYINSTEKDLYNNSYTIY